MVVITLRVMVRFVVITLRRDDAAWRKEDIISSNCTILIITRSVMTTNQTIRYLS